VPNGDSRDKSPLIRVLAQAIARHHLNHSSPKIPLVPHVALFVTLSLILTPLARAGVGAPARDHRIDQIVAVEDDQPGVIVAVVRNGQPIVAQAYGLSDLTHRIPFNVNTRSNIGSTSKQFTACAIILLAAQQKLSLDDDVRTFLPELPSFGEKVTLRHLLTHTSGYREIYQTIELTGRRPFEDHIRRDEVIRVVQRQPSLQNRPGQEWNYNNTGYALLSIVVERVTQTSFATWMKENVFTPVGMNDTYVRVDPGQIIPNSARGYAPASTGYRETKDLDAAMGAGAIYTTVKDLARWMGNYRSGKFGGPDLFAQMTAPVISTGVGNRMYGLGLYVDEWKGLQRVFHRGDDVAHRCAFIYFPQLDAGVIVQSNNASFNAVRAADRIAELYFVDNARAMPDTATIASFQPTQFDRYAGHYEQEPSPGMVFTFSREKERFWATVAGERMELIPRSGARFDVKGQMVQVEFEDCEGREASSATIINQGQPQRLKRVTGALPDSSPPDLTLYAGHYYSDELQTAYMLTVEQNTLVLRHPLFAQPVSLRLLGGDRFSGTEPTSSLTFKRDVQGQITGFAVGNGSNREYVHFTKNP
jgi:CubicO group peptidase (beta-lactamase class C family)